MWKIVGGVLTELLYKAEESVVVALQINQIIERKHEPDCCDVRSKKKKKVPKRIEYQMFFSAVSFL